MLIRVCSGGIVFFQDQVLLLMNDKHEWIFPKGVVRSGEDMAEVARRRVWIEAGVRARILSEGGQSQYEFYSITRQRPVHNKIHWFIMQTDQPTTTVSAELGFPDGGFFPVGIAVQKVTYSQDKSLLTVCYARYKENSATVHA